MLEVLNLSVYYGPKPALQDVSMVVREGEFVSLIGANGAGKSTLLRTIVGLQQAHAGVVKFENQPVNRWAPHRIARMGITFVPEGRGLFPDMRVRENLLLACVNSDVWREKQEEIFGLFPVLKQKYLLSTNSLSGGEQQMLAIARAILSKPKLLLLDEPSLGLAPFVVDALFDIIQALHEDGMTVLLVEQNAHRAMQISQRTYVLENGRMILEGQSNEVMTDPMVQTAYLGI